jgi:NAD(P)-dependent dehydrogenase (short-subunit alcohol dehydrogenase family)
MFDLSKKSILITGSTGYLGSELAKGLSVLGAKIYINSRNEKKCQSLVREIQSLGGTAIVACFDVTSDTEVAYFVRSINKLDVLVNNSYSGASGTIKSSTSKDYITSYQSSVVASANLIKKLIPKFKVAVGINGYASIINIASMYGMVSPDYRIYESDSSTNPPFYGSAKAALIQLTKYAACEFAKDSIRVNSISPGPFPSTKIQNKKKQMVKKIIKKVPMKRIGKSNELVGPVAFLASDASSYITGINLPVDGGWTSW